MITILGGGRVFLVIIWDCYRGPLTFWVVSGSSWGIWKYDPYELRTKVRLAGTYRGDV